MIEKKLQTLFSEMSEQNKELSIRLYGKKIMCVIPKNISRTHNVFENEVRLTRHFDTIYETMVKGIKRKTDTSLTFIFPENFLSPQERNDFLDTLLANEFLEEIIIVTEDSFIASDFVSPLIHNMIMNEYGDVSFESVTKECLMMNIHSFYCNVIGLKNLSAERGRKIVTKLIDVLQPEAKPIDSKELYIQIKYDISLLGETILSSKLTEMLEAKYNPKIR